MKITTFFINLKLVHRNYAWLSAGTRFTDKISYYPAIILSYIRMPFGRKSINYLGNTFLFDNTATPLNMQTYPYEIDKKILKNISLSPEFVLDIGGNIGQFSTTLAYFTSLKSLDIFEPNPDIIRTLNHNIRHLGNIAKTYNYALSSEKIKHGKMFYEPGRSAVGSILEANAGGKTGVGSIPIMFCESPAKLTKRRQYDLIKVDVEGYEIEVVCALKGLRTKYLFMEVSSRNRDRRYIESQLFTAIKDSLGEFELAYSTNYTGTEVTYDILLNFPGSGK